MVNYDLKNYYLDIWWNRFLPPVMCLSLLIMTVTFLDVGLEKVFDPIPRAPIELTWSVKTQF